MLFRSVCIDDGAKYNSLGPCRAGDGTTAETVTDYGLRIKELNATQALFEFALPIDADVEIAAFDVAGRRVATLEHGRHPTGTYQRAWNLDGIPNGMYFVRMRAGDRTLAKTVLKAR